MEVIFSRFNRVYYKSLLMSRKKIVNFDIIDQIITKELSNPQLNGQLIANQLGISRMTLHRRLKEQYKLSASAYIYSKRLVYAQNLLQNTNKTISIIAKETGFYDVAHFSKIFKKVNGLSPKDYR